MSTESSVFTLNEVTKKTIKQIASKTQIPFDLVRNVFEFTLFNSGLALLNNTKKFKEIQIPYFGKILIKQRDPQELEKDPTLSKYDTYFSMSSNLEKMLEAFDNEDFSSLENFLDHKIEKKLESLGD